MIETRAPGKLFIVGEYAVVEAGEPAVLVAVDRFLRVRLTECGQAAPRETSEHVREAIRVIDELRIAQGIPERYFELDIHSELNDASGRKFGLGSSAAVTVAVIEALDRLYELRLGAMRRFKAALLATISVTPRASGGDLAASTFGGWIRYTSPDREALIEHRRKHGVASAIACSAWDGCSVQRLYPSAGLQLLVGWTGSPASTERLVEGVASSLQEEGSTKERRGLFLEQSRACVDAFVSAIESDGSGAQQAIRTARSLLQGLGRSRGILIETDSLSALCDIAESHGASGKPSGAGGGDCGVVLAGGDSDIPGILRGWEERGITRLDLEVHGAEVPFEEDVDDR